MTDLEMTKLCAEAIGLEPYRENGIAQNSSPWSIYIVDKMQGRGYSHYDPLHEDKRAMALVKQCGLSIVGPSPDDARWQAFRVWEPGCPSVMSNDLNRAIVECVAKMEKVKQEHDQGGFMKNVRGPTVAS